jgi:hypothetical protein
MQRGKINDNNRQDYKLRKLCVLTNTPGVEHAKGRSNDNNRQNYKLRKLNNTPGEVTCKTGK